MQILNSSQYEHINKQIHEGLPKENNTTYRIASNVEYNPANREYVVESKVTVMKDIICYITIPTTNISTMRISQDVTNLNVYVGLLIDNLNEKITGTPAVRNYIEVDGVKYYSKNEGE